MPEDHDAYAALRHPGYRRLLGSAVLASTAAEAQAAAVGWELYKRTGSELTLAMVGLVQFLPVLLLALPAGQAADRFSRKGLFQIALAVSALASLGLGAVSLTHAPVPLAYLCLMLMGAARAFTAPARSALLPQVVPPEALGNAVTWNSSGWQFANVVGPALGGFLYWLTDAAPVYLLTAACSLTSVALLAPVRPRATERPALARSLSSLLAGARFVWRTELLLAAITLDLFAVLLGGATALLPAISKKVLGVEELGNGILRAAPAVGAVLMGLALAHRPPLRRPGRALLLSVAGFGVATVGFGLSRDFGLSFLLLAVLGALDNVSVVVRGTLMQVLTPDDMRGRVAAVNSLFISSSNELGAFESGAAAHLIGLVPAVVAGGVGTVAVVAFAALYWRRLRELGPLHALAPAGPEAAEAQAEEETARPP